MVLNKKAKIFALIFLAIILLILNIYIKSPNEIDGIKVEEDKLIDREVFFGNPDKVSVTLSDDGKYIAYIAPYEAVLNIYLAPRDDVTNAKAITFDNNRGVRSYFWAKDNNHIIYGQDKKGDENMRLYSLDIKDNKIIELTPAENIKSSVLKISKKMPEHILALINDRVPEYFDIYKINIVTGERELLYENKGQYSSFLADEDFNIKFAYKLLGDGKGQIFQIENNELDNPSLFMEISPEDMLNTGMLHLSTDNKYLYMLDSVGRNCSALVRIELENDKKEIIFESDRADVDDVIIEPSTRHIQAVAINYDRISWSLLDDKIKSDIDYLNKLEDGELVIVSKNYDDDFWIVSFKNSDKANKYYLYDRKNTNAKFLFSSNSKLDNHKFSKMHPKIIKTKDGLDLVSYLTVPRWMDKGDGTSSEKLPLILYVHGGPNHRDGWSFNPVAQWLANRGYAVLQVNYRGSTGFGKNFTNSGDGQWSKKMQRDLEEAVEWCIKQKIADPNKVVIMGGSYGGYASLVGITMTPDKYVAAIDIVGPSNLETLIKSVPPYWKPHLAHLKKITGGDVDTKEGRKLLASISPITYVKNIKNPLMIVHGANDPRVKQAESDQIVASMKEQNIPVLYLLYPDEGHGLARPENRLSMYAHIEIFLANFAGGRAQDNSNNFPNSSIKIVEGENINWSISARSR